jgi:hypothetical protein
MDGNTRNIAASVHQRLLNKARESSRPFIEKTFEKRKTPLTSEPTIFNPSFMKDDTKQAQW